MFVSPALPAPVVTSCPQQAQDSIVRDPLQPGLHHGRVPRFENGRLTIVAPTSAVELTNSVDVTLTLHGQDARCVATVQCYQNERNGLCMARLGETVQIVPVLARPDGSHYITFTPLLVGRSGLIVTAEFSDGVFSEQTAYLSVVYPTRIPDKLTVSLTGSSGWVGDKVRLSLKQGSRYLRPEVRYTSYPRQFQVAADKVRFTVKTAGPGEVIRLAPSTGEITPVALGHALVTTEFGGATTRTCVVVTDDTVGTIARINCDDLLRP